MTENIHLDPSLTAAVEAWIADDPDASTAAELTELLDQARGRTALPSDVQAAEAVAELADRFSGLLQFGTAGLRGAIAGGPARMNRSVVIRAAAGLTSFLVDSLRGAGTPGRIVIGYDARHRSHDFAVDTAAVAQAAGLDVHILPGALPTPVLAYAVRALSADAGVMVTASHNPPQDNGYKVYLGGRVVTDAGQGAQIVPPYDSQIAERIAAVPSTRSVPRANSGWQTVPDRLIADYVRDAAANAGPVTANVDRSALSIVITSLHGVGDETARRALHDAGFTTVHAVAEQQHPDPDFPTVAFPNPEEPGAIDRALDLAHVVKADIVLANDPDADRCAMAVRDPLASPATGGWRMLHGDEVGALLGEFIAGRVVSQGGTGAVLANSIVSSRLLAKIAMSHRLQHRTTLTGFKWISRVPDLAFGYEEALGYCVDPAKVRDKDGISAAVTLAQLAANLKSQGRTVMEFLDDLALEHGLHISDQLAARFTDVSVATAAVGRLRVNPPASLGGSPIVEFTDLSAGGAGLPPTDALVLRTEDDTRVIVRPSGTEPKLKCYIEVIRQVPAGEAVARSRVAARDQIVELKTELSRILGLS